MIVFGDLAAHDRARGAVASSIADFRRALNAPAGIARHSALVGAYIETARFAQAGVDAEFARSGQDSMTPLHGACAAALRALARVILVSWRSAFEETAEIDETAIGALITLIPDAHVEARIAEGFAFYALYPESCLDVCPNEEDGAVVVGVRSIGMALAPLLAEALNAPHCFTVRPAGHPFARACRLAPDLRDAVSAQRDARFCIVDEGPGLSGSSFIAAARALEELGVRRERITFIASNRAGPGAAATQATRERWRVARKKFLDTEPATNLALASCRFVRDMSGGLWRDGNANAAAPANRPYERRKMLIENGEGRWLAKFSGLGAMSAYTTRISRALSDAGLTPKAGEFAHGFFMQRWIEGARTIDEAPRDALIARISDYIAFRATALSALPTGGATIEQLFEMTRRNCAEDGDAGRPLLIERFAPKLARLARIERPVATDNRMQAWEWIVTENGAVLKCDGADHCAAHDLIGCRDAAWDVAGAIVEFSLRPHESDWMISRLDAQNVAISPELLDFFVSAYCAFQLGAAIMAADANAQWPEDAQRWRGQAEKYRAALRLRA